MPVLNSAHRLIAGLLTAAAVLVVQAPASASEEFPAALQRASGMPCTPACAVCHGVTPGTAGTFMNKKLGATLFNINGIVLPHRADQLEAAYGVYASKPENAAAVASLKSGVDPENGVGLCGPTYGCAVHVAKKAPASDISAPLWIVGAMVVGGLLRRRKPAR